MRIVFMGTPDFAKSSLQELYEAGEQIVGVITQPDKPKGRGYVLTPPPVKVYAQEKNIQVYQPTTLRDEDFANLIEQLDPQLIVVVAYGKILPENILQYPKYGCINVHGSLLPKYRGAAPIQRAIIDGEKQTGITTMYMEAGLDTGDMLLRGVIDIEENDNFESMHDKLAILGAEMLVQTVRGLENEEIIPQKQDDSLANYAKKIEKSDCVIDFSKNVSEVHNQIRGLSPMPLAFTNMPDGAVLKITKSEISSVQKKECEKIGQIVSTGKDIKIACGDGILSVLEVIPQGKGKMSAGDFARGRKIEVGQILGKQ